MILTEPEAKTKWCPHARIQPHQAAVNRLEVRMGHDGSRGAEPHPGALCLASGCMKWRWAPEKSPEEREARKPWMGKDNVGEPMGYCGA